MNGTARTALWFVLAVTVAMGACSRKSACTEKGIAVQFTGDHDHSATISSERLERGATGPFVAHGADHDHVFMLKPDDIQKLRRGEAVATRTSSNNAHVHEVTLRCKE